jgi:AcrR family transcriptional regulator
MTAARNPRCDATRNRAALLEAAGTLFAERGVAVGVAEVAERAGVGAGTVYRHFASKDDLAMAVAVDRLDQLHARVVAAGESAAGQVAPHARLRQVLQALFDGLVADRGLLEALAEPLRRLPDLDALRERLRGAVAGPLQAAQDSGDVRADVTVADVVTLVGSLARPGDGPGADAQRHLRIALDGLRAVARTD